MSFSGFSPQMLEFLAENHIRNSKPWYEEHKEEYRRLAVQPYYELAELLAPVMQAIDPLFVTQPSRCLSRVRRDTRYTKNKDLYRDHLWLTYRHPRKSMGSALCYYFETEQESWGYGVGYYDMPRDVLAECQTMILHEDVLFQKAFHALNHSDFVLYGEDYKRVKFPDAPQQYQPWLNKKRFGASFVSDDFEALFQGSFCDKMIKDIQLIQPFYAFLRTAEERAGAKRREAFCEVHGD